MAFNLTNRVDLSIVLINKIILLDEIILPLMN